MADHSRPVPGYAAFPPPYRPPPPPTTPRATFLRRLTAILLVTLILAGIIALIIWLILRPRLPQFRVDSLSLSNLTTLNSSNLLTATCDLRFTVRNPNRKLTLSSSSPLAASLYYKGESLSDTTVPPFVLGKSDEATFRATFVAVNRYVDGWVVEGINWEKVRGSVSFNVRMAGWVRFKAGSWPGRRRYLRLYCGELPVGVSGKGGTLVGGPRRCVVGM